MGNKDLQDETNEDVDLSIDNTDKQAEVSQRDETPLTNVEGAVDNPYKTSRKKKVFNIVFLLVAITISLTILLGLSNNFSGGNISTIEKLFSNLNWRFVAYTFVAFLILLFGDAMKYVIAYKRVIKKFNVVNSMKVSVLGRYYDYITPLTVGGQPFQIYYIANKGTSGTNASSIITFKVVIDLFAYIGTAIVVVATGNHVLNLLNNATQTLVKTGFIIGITAMFILPFMLVLFIIAPKIARAVSSFFIKIGYKLKFVKDYDKTLSKFLTTISNYRQKLFEASKSLPAVIFEVLFSVITNMAFMSIPYFVAVSISAAQPSWDLYYNMMVFGWIINVAVSFIPTPGNSGGIEAMFLLIYAQLPIIPELLFWVVFISRILTYYSYILFGSIGSVISTIRKGVKEKRFAKQLNIDNIK